MTTDRGSTLEPDGIRAVLFDLDGVLVDSFESWHAVVNEAARRFDRPPIDRVLLAKCFGQGPEDDARTFYPGRTAAEIQAVYDEVMPGEIARIVRGPETHGVLDALGRRGFERAVVTNTQVSLARRILDATGIAERVDAWEAVGPGVAEKPDPDLLLRALDRFGLAPGQAVMVGDTHYDEDAARSAGTAFVFFDLRAGDSLDAALSPLLDARASHTEPGSV